MALCRSFCLFVLGAVRLPTKTYRVYKEGGELDDASLGRVGGCVGSNISTKTYLPLRFGEDVVSVRRNKKEAVKIVHGEWLRVCGS